ncbi:MAG TPA: pyridoxamine 5'-phosphate oxidase family protein [Syntrophomonadaceae bacterium]|nr:pyridoxamine 5'-phosphate oxidase family protein [Syntrophomonadaceae bacterium]
MAILTDDVKKVLQDAVMWVLATADQNGIPNAVPINYVDILGDKQIMLVDILMKKTLANLEVNKNVAVSVWHEEDGYQIKGTASIETSGANFESGVAQVKKDKPFLDPKGVVIVDITEIYLTTPGPDNGKKL